MDELFTTFEVGPLFVQLEVLKALSECVIQPTLMGRYTGRAVGSTVQSDVQ